MPGDEREAVRGDCLIVPGPMRQVNIDQLDRDKLRQEKKLPPEHGPTPRFTQIPPGESLPKKDREQE
jgi:hypothetical protein